MSTPADLAQVARLTQAGELHALLVRSGVAVDAARATYLRLKPGAGALIAVDLVHRDAAAGTMTTPGYVRVHGPARAAELVRKWHAGRATPTPLGQGVRLLEGGCAVLFVFPNDAAIRGLRFVAEPDKLKRLLAGLPAIGGAGWRVRARASSFARVRYKPERRLILRARLALRDDATGAKAARNVFVRFFTDTRGEGLARLMTALRAGGLGDCVPEPLGAVAGGRLFVEAEVDGEELFGRLGRDTGDAGAVATVLARLHACRIDELPARPPAAVLANALEGAEALARIVPELVPVLDELTARLRASVPPPAAPPATLHGDCHLHQFLVARSGYVLVDFERAARGDPAIDLGHLGAHAIGSALRQPDRTAAQRYRDLAQQVVARYRALRPGVSLTALPFYTACGLLDRALLPYRHLETDWREHTEALLRAAVAELPPAQPGTAPRPGFFAPGAAWCARGYVFHPSTAPRWPGYLHAAAGGREYGVYDCSADRFVARAPEADAALPGLRARLAGGELLSYRAGRRATLRVDAPRPAFVKLLPPAKLGPAAARLHFAARAAAADPAFPAVPELLACDVELGALTLAPLAGRSLHDLLAGAGALPAAALAALARGLAALHRASPADLPALAARPLQAWRVLVAPHDPELAESIARALVVLEGLLAAARLPGVVHGDLHDRNVFLAGERVGLLDLDALGPGDVHEDVGNLAAHFVLRSLQRGAELAAGNAQAAAWLEAYARCAPALSVAAARAATARSLLRLACVYRFRSRWLDLAPALVQAGVAWGHAAARTEIAS